MASHGSTKSDPKKCNRSSSVEIDSTQIDSTRIDRPASETVAQEELDTHAIGEATCEMGMATATAGNIEQQARLIQEGNIARDEEVGLIGEGDMATLNRPSAPALPPRSANSNTNGPLWLGQVDVLKTPARMLIQEVHVASKYETSPATSTWKSEVTADDITKDGTNTTPTLNPGSGTSKNHAQDSPLSSITPSIHETLTRVDSTSTLTPYPEGQLGISTVDRSIKAFLCEECEANGDGTTSRPSIEHSQMGFLNYRRHL